MSYPRKVHTLIVEDERTATDGYRDIFRRLAERYALVEPRFARCVEDASRILASPAVLHLLILDLGLPLETRGEAMAGIDAGSSLLKLAAERDHHPIPALIVISARLGIANLTELDGQLKQAFWHSALVNKGVDEDIAITNAIEAVQRYCDVGVHIRDAGARLCPTLSPREEDMLRRCVLGQQPQCIGLDLEWWGTYHAGSDQSAGQTAETKVLAGEFLLDEGMGNSMTSFFKFRSNQGAAHTRRDAGIMVQKLSHVKVVSSLIASSRSLLVTQKVGALETAPISLSGYLRRDPVVTNEQIGPIVASIADQLGRLGQPDNQEWPTRRLFWPHHDRAKLAQVWNEFASAEYNADSGDTPLAVYDQLRQSEAAVFVRVRRCTHGDLNATNIALDEDVGMIDAYIFDAEGVHPDIDIRDLATLEVTSLLHHALEEGRSLVPSCADFYDAFVDPPREVDTTVGPSLVQNTRKLIAAIRRSALASADQSVYAIVVFDVVLQQLGGLAWQRSRNKIIEPSEAVLLAYYAANWCARSAGLTVVTPSD